MKDLINREKLVSLSLLTALIITLVFANLNVSPTGAGGAGNPGTNMTFNSNVTMEFEPGNITWIGSGFFLEVKNATAGANITEIQPGTWLRAKERPGWWFEEPKAGEWWYIYGALYGKYIAFKIDYAYGPVVGHTHFNISETYDHWLRTPINFTGPTYGFAETPVEMFEAERMMTTIETGVEYLAYLDFTFYYDPPPADSWWTIIYHDVLYDHRFHISSVDWLYGTEEEGEVGYTVTFDDVRNNTNLGVPQNLTVPAPCPVEGVEGVQLVAEVDTIDEYYIKSPEPLLPENCTWWNITSPDELDGTRFHINSSERKPFGAEVRSYMNIYELENATGQTVSSITLTNATESIEAVLDPSPTVDSIEACEWFNVINGTTPSSRTWWNITTSSPSNATLVGVQFYVDSAGEGVFHIDETSGDVTVDPAVNNVTAEELIPAIYIDPAITNTTALGAGKNFTISIKTNYTLQVWSYEFTLEWNPAVSNCTKVANMELFAGATFMNGTVDNVNGKLSLTGAQFEYGEGERAPQVYPTSDNCTLANVTFKVAGTGDSDITLGPETRLVKVTKDGKGVEQNVIDDVTGKMERGYFCNYDGPVVHDVAVTNITCYYSGVGVGETYKTWTVQVNVTVLNNGTLTEQFDVKLYIESWLLDAKTEIRIASSTNTTAEFSWNLAGAWYGYRGVCAKAIIAFGIPDATDADNVFIGSLLVKLTGDVYKDGVVDVTDFVNFCGQYPKTTVPPGITADLDGDGDVDSADFVLLCTCWEDEQIYY